MNNTIWALKNQGGKKLQNTLILLNLALHTLRNFLQHNRGRPSLEIIRVARLFPRFIEEDEVEPLTAPVSEKELLEVLQSFQKGKSPGPDGWPIEFYLGCIDILGTDLLKVVEESRERGHIHNPSMLPFLPSSQNQTIPPLLKISGPSPCATASTKLSPR
jgi:hypothetical protein